MKKHFQSVALVRKIECNRTFWLLNWNQRSHQWQFVSGDRLGKESFRETATREVAWQLKLSRQKDFIVSSMAQLSMEYVGRLPAEHFEKHIAVAFYCVDIYRNSVLDKLANNHGILWVSAADICSGETTSGEPIDVLVVHWINKWRILQPWQL